MRTACRWRAATTGRCNLAGQPWFERLRTTLQPIRLVVRSTSSGRAMFAYAAPVLDSAGALQGIVAASVSRHASPMS